MIRYVALLRAINVGGKRLVKMEDLRRMFASLGLENVKTYIQSGNVIFETLETNAGALTKTIEQELHRRLGFEVAVLLRTVLEIEETVKHNPFAANTEADVKMYVTFLSAEPKSDLQLAFMAFRSEVDDFHIRQRELYSLSRPSVGESILLNSLIEKKLKVSATTRNWATVNKIRDLCRL